MPGHGRQWISYTSRDADLDLDRVEDRVLDRDTEPDLDLLRLDPTDDDAEGEREREGMAEGPADWGLLLLRLRVWEGGLDADRDRDVERDGVLVTDRDRDVDREGLFVVERERELERELERDSEGDGSAT